MNKTINCFPNYTISSTGVVTNIKRNKELKHTDLNGYPSVELWNSGKNKRVHIHRLVALHFIYDKTGDIVNHKDFDRYNNNVENLELVTQRENILHARAHGRGGCGAMKKIIATRDDGIHFFETITQASLFIDVSRTQIHACLNKTKTSVKNMRFEYA